MKEVEFRFFKSPEDRIKFLKLLRWNRMDTISKKILIPDPVPQTEVFKVVNNKDKISFVYYSLKPMTTHNSAFIKSTILGHITYRKGTKKLWITNLNTLKNLLCTNTDNHVYDYSIVNILRILGLEALSENRKYDITHYITKVTAKAIITGRCTSFKDLTKRYYSSIGIKNINGKRAASMNKYFYHTKRCLRVAKNQENFFKYWARIIRHSPMVRDTVDMAFTLQRKIDFKWSEKRMKMEHDAMKDEILTIKLKGMDNQYINYDDVTFPFIKGLGILSSLHDFIRESDIMNHCVGTSNSYFNKAGRYESILLTYDRLGFRGTVEISLVYDKEKNISHHLINQFYGYGDCKAPNVNRDDMKELLNSKELIKFMNDVINLKYEPESESESEWYNKFFVNNPCGEIRIEEGVRVEDDNFFDLPI